MDPTRFHLVANARYHDTDYARLRLLELFSEHDAIRASVASDFSRTAELAESVCLVTYTCDLRPTAEEEVALREFVSKGGRWIALHGTNALLDMGPQGMIAPRTHDVFMQTLGSRFIAHPPLEPYTVTVADPDHPLVRGMEPFEATDELYLCEMLGDVHPLLETRYSGTFQSGYAENEWPDDAPRLVAYTHRVGEGEVLYVTLGHCCGKFDMRPIVEEAEVVRGSWESPVFVELLRRAIRWGMGQLETS